MYGLWRKPNIEPTAFGQAMQQSELYDPTTAAVARTYAEEATIGTGTLKADVVAADVVSAEKTGSPITEDEYKNSAELYSEGVSWHENMTRESALVTKEFNDAARKRTQIISDASTSQSVVGFAAGFGAGVFEPKNVVSGLAVGAAAGPLAEIGILGKSLQRAYQMRKTATLGQRALMGGAEGVIAGAVVEPSNRYSAKILQQDYTMMDSLFNIATSAAFGSLMPVAGAGLKNAAPFMKEKIAKFKGRTMDVVAAEVDLATTQFASGQRVNVGIIEATEIGSVARKPVAEQVKAAERFVRLTETPEFVARFKGSRVLDEQSAPKMLFHGTNRNFDSHEINVQKNSEQLRGEGIYYTDNPKLADMYIDEAAGANIRPAYLDLKNPLEVGPEELFAIGKGARGKKLTDIVKSLGHDGIIYKDPINRRTEYVAFKPSQIIPAFGDKSLPDIIAQVESANTATLAKTQADALDPQNDTLIDYDAIDAADERRAITGVENEAEAEAYFMEAENEIRQMIDQDILNEADLDEYRAALEELNSRAPIDALETLKLCFTRG